MGGLQRAEPRQPASTPAFNGGRYLRHHAGAGRIRYRTENHAIRTKIRVLGPPQMRFSLATLFLAAGVLPLAANAQTDWPTYGGDPAGTRFSQLTQIDIHNVSKLTRAWTYHMK